MWPSNWSSSPARMRSTELLPAPLAPKIPIFAPRYMPNDTCAAQLPDVPLWSPACIAMPRISPTHLVQDLFAIRRLLLHIVEAQDDVPGLCCICFALLDLPRRLEGAAASAASATSTATALFLAFCPFHTLCSPA